MHRYPIFLNIQGVKCLVAGGGKVGTRKAQTLLDCGARVVVVSLQFSDRLQQMAEDANLLLIKRAYRSEDLQNTFLVIGATNDSRVNQRIGIDAHKSGVLCNIADRPESSDFIVPSIIRRGDLTLTISTGGKSPAMAKRIRQGLENQFGNEYSEFFDLMGRIRQELVAQEHAPQRHKQLFETLIDAGLLEMLREKRIDAVDELLQSVLGREFTFSRLMTT
jgi:precorrin-2 dehydrogenase/sirohydrochlorin ferrochelatase